MSLGHLGHTVQFLDLLEKLERLVPGASEAPAHDCASDPGQAEDYFFVMIFCNYVFFVIIFSRAPDIRIRETGGYDSLVELSGRRKPNEADVIDNVLFQPLEFRMRNQIVLVDNKVLWRLQTIVPFKQQDQKDLLNLPLYRAMYFYIVMCSL